MSALWIILGAGCLGAGAFIAGIAFTLLMFHWKIFTFHDDGEFRLDFIDIEKL